MDSWDQAAGCPTLTLSQPAPKLNCPDVTVVSLRTGNGIVIPATNTCPSDGDCAQSYGVVASTAAVISSFHLSTVTNADATLTFTFTCPEVGAGRARRGCAAASHTRASRRLGPLLACYAAVNADAAAAAAACVRACCGSRSRRAALLTWRPCRPPSRITAATR